MVYQTTLEENVRLPTNSIGDGYVFRLKSDSDSRADSIQIPTLEDNVKLPTTAPGAGYVFRRKKKSRWKRKEKSTYRFKHEWLFKGLVFVAIFTLRLNLGACNGVLHPKSSPSANLTIEIRGYIKTADSKLLTPTLTPTLEIRGYIKTADSKLLTPTLAFSLSLKAFFNLGSLKMICPNVN